MIRNYRRELKKLGFEIRRGTTDGSDDRLDGWYLEKIGDLPHARRGPGFPSIKKAYRSVLESREAREHYF